MCWKVYLSVHHPLLSCVCAACLLMHRARSFSHFMIAIVMNNMQSLGLKLDLVNKDLLLYKSILSKMNAAKELMAEFLEREQRKQVNFFALF